MRLRMVVVLLILLDRYVLLRRLIGGFPLMIYRLMPVGKTLRIDDVRFGPENRVLGLRVGRCQVQDCQSVDF